MHTRSSPPYHRLSRRAQRRQKLHRAMTWSFAGLVLLWSFGAGYLWRQWRAKAAAAPAMAVEVSEEQQAEALRLFDGAVQAKFNELWSEATRLAFEVRKMDPATPGVDIFIGEIALEREDLDLMGSAARAALRQRPTSANAKLLIALQAWILRGQTGASEAGMAASKTLQEAASDELSNVPVRFFAGDFLRAIGRPAEAHANLLGGLYRLHAWHSAALITAKLFLAAEEAGVSVSLASSLSGIPEVDLFGSSTGALHRAIRSAGDVGAASSAVRAIFTVQQIGELASDPGLTSAAAVIAGSDSPDLSLPYAGMTDPAEKPK